MKALFIGGSGTISTAIVRRLAVDYILSHPERQVEDPDFDAWCDRVIDALESVKKKVSAGL